MFDDHFLLTNKMSRSEVLTLYRRLLRLHDRLPGDFAALGRKFVQEEFKRHKTASPDQARMFTREWTVSIIYTCIILYVQATTAPVCTHNIYSVNSDSHCI